MPKQAENSHNHHLRADTFLRAIAILSVIGIHILSSLKKSPYLSSSDHQIFAVGLDQLFRFSVPLFVALSGYGLSQKFATKKVEPKNFWKSRIKKLIPAYLFWSLICIAVFALGPWWYSATAHTNITLKLIFGKADYHLYFVPMILQLYLLFPLVLWAYKKQPLPTLVGALILQLAWFWWFSYQHHSPLNLSFLQKDREQYVWAGNWIFYFVLGMSLPKIHQLMSKYKLLLLSLVVATLGIWLLIVHFAIININVHRLDPLMALRFTRYSVVAFASLAIVTATWWAKKVRFVPLPLWWIGQKSYYIYLVHTLLLRIVFR